MPALDAFPHKLWAQIVARRLRHALLHLFAYQDPAGGDDPEPGTAVGIGAMGEVAGGMDPRRRP